CQGVMANSILSNRLHSSLRSAGAFWTSFQTLHLVLALQAGPLIFLHVQTRKDDGSSRFFHRTNESRDHLYGVLHSIYCRPDPQWLGSPTRRRVPVESS